MRRVEFASLDDGLMLFLDLLRVDGRILECDDGIVFTLAVLTDICVGDEGEGFIDIVLAHQIPHMEFVNRINQSFLFGVGYL